jgi:peptidyl-prolyl cis-trans isomerase C
LSLVCLSLAPACNNKPAEPTKADAKNVNTIPEPKAAPGELGALPDPVALVNGKPVTLAEFKTIYDLKVQKYAERGREIPPSADRRYRKSITERLVYQEVLRQEAAAKGVKYNEAELAEREAQQKQGIKDWDKHLVRRGETEQSLRDMYIAELVEKQLLELGGKLGVTDAEVDEEYEKIKPNYKSDAERVHAAHILIPIGPQNEPTMGAEKPPEPSPEDKKKWTAEALAKAEELYKKAIAPGADFGQLAKENSIGPSADKGGDLGVFTKDRMVEEFSAVAFKLKPGEISKPVETKFGVHIIKMIDKYPPGDLPKEALVEQIRERLGQRKLHQGRRDLKEELLGRYKVENKMEEALGPDPRAVKRPGRMIQPAVPNGLPPDHPPIGDGSVPPANGPAPAEKAAPMPEAAPPGGKAEGGDADGE